MANLCCHDNSSRRVWVLFIYLIAQTSHGPITYTSESLMGVKYEKKCGRNVNAASGARQLVLTSANCIESDSGAMLCSHNSPRVTSEKQK